ncbi:hypothetical protein JCM8547_004065 [Rhodosporidiobolus lusitaniae]
MASHGSGGARSSADDMSSPLTAVASTMVDARTGVASASAAAATSARSSGHGGSSSSSSSTSGDTSSDTSSSSAHGSSTGTTTYGSSSGKSSGGGGKAKSHGGNPLPAVNWMWTAFCGVLFLLALRRAYVLYGHKKHEKRTAASAKVNTGGKGSTKAAVGTASRNALFATSFPVWMAGPETVADALWTMAYFSVTVVITLYSAPWLTGTQQQTANVFGIVAYAQAPFMMFFAMKNNPISLLIGVPYQNLNYLHRASSRAMFVWSWLHTGLSFKNLDSRNQWKDTYIVWGWVALAAYQFLWMSSFGWIRRRFHQFFFICHVVLAFFYLIGCYYHWAALGFWLYASFIIWGFDRLLRLVRVAHANRVWKSGRGQCEVKLLEDDCLELTFNRPGFKWLPGQHVFLSSGVSISPNLLEAHPFTAANAVSDEGKFTILARIYDGFTRQIRDKLSSQTSTTISCFLDGPYGESHSLRGYDSVLIVAGGTGIAPWMSHLLSLVGPSKLPPRVQLVHIVWMVQQSTSISWIAPLLETAAQHLKKYNPQITVLVDVHVTRGSIAHLVDSSSFPSGSNNTSREKLSLTDSGEASSEGVTSFPVLEHKPESFESSSGEKQPALASQNAGLSPAAAPLVSWRSGRPNLVELIEKDAKECPERMALGVCGPRGLSNTVRAALKTVNNFRTVRGGMIPIEYFEESLAPKMLLSDSTASQSHDHPFIALGLSSSLEQVLRVLLRTNRLCVSRKDGIISRLCYFD